MKSYISKIFKKLIIILVAGGLFFVSFLYEGNVLSTIASQQGHQFAVGKISSQVEVNRNGKGLLFGSNADLEMGDVIYSGNNEDISLLFAQDGELRLDKNSRLEITYIDFENQKYIFKLLSGRIWLQNVYSSANVNILFDGGIVIPGQSVVLVSLNGENTQVYANKGGVILGFVENINAITENIDENNSVIINKLFLPFGTEATVYANKIKENKDTIQKLLFSKLIKEFNYATFDKKNLSSDFWLNNNISKDARLTENIRNKRLQNIRTRGLKYLSLDTNNYKIDQDLRGIFNNLTVFKDRVAKRDLVSLYDLLYDAEYLFDYGRKDEGQKRLNKFVELADQLFEKYGDELKKSYVDRIHREYEFLSFVNPVDSLFDLKKVLENIYLDLIKGSDLELSVKFEFLTNQIGVIGYYAENNDFKNLKTAFDTYMENFKILSESYQKEITNNIALVQRQNQALDNLFNQYASLYRQNYFTNKLFIENKYLSLLPANQDKIEEIQNIIVQRINFLNRLEIFYLNGDVPLMDAQNILALEFSEIEKIRQLGNSKVAVSQIFQERMDYFGVFGQFINSSDISSIKQVNLKTQYENFKNNFKSGVVAGKNMEIDSENTLNPNIDVLGNNVDETIKNTNLPLEDLDQAKENIEDVKIVDQEDANIVKPKVPRVKPQS